MTKEDDIKTVCNALIEHFEHYGYDTWDTCRYCGAYEPRAYKAKEYVHEPTCPVLVAKDLLS
jgi:hypothetical protein